MSRIRTTRAIGNLRDDNAGCRSRGAPTVARAMDERGATLILALVFVVVVSAIATALTSWVTSDLKNTSKFTNAQSTQSAASSATEAALQSVRYSFAALTLNASPPTPCWKTGLPPGQITINEQNNSVTLSVWCSTFYDPLSTHTRTVTISTCLSTVSAPVCASSPLLQAVVVFNDYPSTGASQCSPGSTDQATCGTGMSLISWAYGVAPPSVTSVADSTSASCSTSKLVTINGIGFSGVTAVDFMPSGGNTILTGTHVIVNAGGTTVTACAWTQMVIGTTYQVTVTTPAGTSATGSSSALTY